MLIKLFVYSIRSKLVASNFKILKLHAKVLEVAAAAFRLADGSTLDSMKSVFKRSFHCAVYISYLKFDLKAILA